MIQQISRFRSELMGIATLWVVLYHYRSYAPDFLNYLSATGYAGVDIFFFLSGFGLTIGWLKGLMKPSSPLQRTTSFYQRRLLRTFPTLFLLSLVWARHNWLPWGRSVIAATGIGWYVPQIPYWDWFMPSMFAFYLLFPVWMWAGQTSMLRPTNRRVLINCLLCIALSLVLTAIIILTGKAGMNLLAFTRIPIFFIGSWFGYSYYHKQELSHNFYLSAAIIAIIGLCLEVPFVLAGNVQVLWGYGLFWLPFILITPGLLFLLTWCFAHVPDWACLPFRFLGGISFEFYLMHCLYFEFLERRWPDLIPQHPYLSFLLLLVVVGTLSWLFLRCINFVLTRLKLTSPR